MNCHVGTCKFINNQPKCQCPVDFEGEFCDFYRCSGYCHNHGLCSVDGLSPQDYTEDSLPPLKCKCPAEWTGSLCEIPLSKCQEQCHNGAKCKAKSNGENECICTDGFRGANCQDCDDLQCQNNGTCKRDKDGKSGCECLINYNGTRCETSICEGYCNDHGECTTRWGTAQCKCEDGYWGRQCESDGCTGFCVNGGTCTMDINGNKTCQCIGRYGGPRCEQIGKFCHEGYCQNSGICTVVGERAYCNCTTEWSGDFCQVGKCSLNFSIYCILQL